MFADPLVFSLTAFAQAKPTAFDLNPSSAKLVVAIERVALAASAHQAQAEDLHAAVARLLRAVGLRACAVERRTSFGLQQTIVETQQRIYDSIDSPQLLGFLAKNARLSESRLRHVFVQEVGSTISQYRLWCRLMRTLNQTALSCQTPDAEPSQVRALPALAHLAIQQGFCDQAHMSRTFSRFLGRTPGSLRGRFIRLANYR